MPKSTQKGDSKSQLGFKPAINASSSILSVESIKLEPVEHESDEETYSMNFDSYH